MREKGINAGRKRRKARTTDSNHHMPIAPNLLERDFEACAPNKKWVTDITFIATLEGWHNQGRSTGYLLTESDWMGNGQAT
jgi:transposase InsO family protein